MVVKGRPHSVADSNEPTKEELECVVAFVMERLEALESLDVELLTPQALSSYCDQARSIKQSFADLASEDGGYYKLPALVDSVLNTQIRINRFLTRAAEVMGVETPPEPAEGAQQMPQWSDSPTRATNYTVEQYLDHLESTVSGMTPEFHLVKGRQTRLSEGLCGRLIAYMAFLAGKPSGSGVSRLVFLLRDTLLLCLGMRRLSRCGWPVDVRALLINRAVLERLGQRAGRANLYVECYNSIFAALALSEGLYGSAFIDSYRRVLAESIGSRFAVVSAFLAAQGEAHLSGADGWTIVDNGVHGTMPLLCMSTMPAIGDLRMYTAVPWLQRFYGQRIYSCRSMDMREHERLSCQERLFQCHVVAPEAVLIAETPDPKVREESYLEIRLFLDAVDIAFGCSPR